MQKRGQITLFVIIGILILIGFGFAIYLTGITQTRLTTAGQINLKAESAALKSMRDECLIKTLNEGVDFFGLKKSSEEQIEYYLSYALFDCIDYSMYKDKGVQITEGKLEPEITITDDAVLADISYPVTMRLGENEIKLLDFNYYMKRERTTRLPTKNQLTTTQISLQSDDKQAELIIPTGTKITDAEGNTIPEIKIKALDKNFDGLSNSVVIGAIVYDAQPDGILFNPPITMTLRFNDFDLPPGTDKQFLSIGYWDKEAGIWRSLESTVDEQNNKVTAQIEHFSEYAVLRVECKPEEEVKTNEVTFSGMVFQQSCGGGNRNIACENNLFIKWGPDKNGKGWYEKAEDDSGSAKTPYLKDPSKNNLDVPENKIPNDKCVEKLVDYDKQPRLKSGYSEL